MIVRCRFARCNSKTRRRLLIFVAWYRAVKGVTQSVRWGADTSMRVYRHYACLTQIVVSHAFPCQLTKYDTRTQGILCVHNLCFSECDVMCSARNWNKYTSKQSWWSLPEDAMYPGQTRIDINACHCQTIISSTVVDLQYAKLQYTPR